MFLNGDGIRERDRRAESITDASFLLLFNAGDDSVDFRLPGDVHGTQWETMIDTSGSGADSPLLDAVATVPIPGSAVFVLRAHDEPVVIVDHSVAASFTAASASNL